MGRSDQYIGLNDLALSIIDDLKEKSISCVEDKFVLVDEQSTLCGCEIYGTCWTFEMPGGETYFVKEVVQEEPWSSGPMYFTCLDCGTGLCGQWMYASPLNENEEFNSVAGLIYL